MLPKIIYKSLREKPLNIPQELFEVVEFAEDLSIYDAFS